MAMVKMGKGDGKILDVHSNFAKLGAKYTCRKCGRQCTASTSNDITAKVCATCRKSGS